jgi:signal transduction histidine kinase
MSADERSSARRRRRSQGLRVARGAALALVAGVTDVVLFSYQYTDDPQPGMASAVMVYGYSALAALTLPWRRRAPVLVFVAVWVHAVLAGAVLESLRFFPLVCVLVGLHSVAAYRSARLANLALVATAVPAGLSIVDSARGVEDEVGALAVGAVAVLAFGLAAWGTGRILAVYQARAERLAAEQKELMRKAVAVERMHIARELHDSVAHSITVIVLQAAGAARVMHTRPGSAGPALNEIENAGRQALEELRRLLTVLRANEAAVDGSASDDHQPCIDDLDALLDQLHDAGLPVRLHRSGEARTIAPSVSRTAYRIVQEALTNVTKHAPGSVRVDVGLSWTPEQLVVDVANEVPDRASGPVSGLACGFGLVGLRERAAIVGGRLTAGVTSDGFKVTAVLPVSAAPVQPVPQDGLLPAEA